MSRRFTWIVDNAAQLSGCAEGVARGAEDLFLQLVGAASDYTDVLLTVETYCRRRKTTYTYYIEGPTLWAALEDLEADLAADNLLGSPKSIIRALAT